MKAILIFDNVNDLLFSKWDDSFIENLKSLHQENPDATANMVENRNVTESYKVAQLLSPIVTSQRVMAAQFGNSYSSMQCKDNTAMVFEELLEHMLIIISQEEVDDAHRELLDCKTLVHHITGQNIYNLNSPVYQQWLDVLLTALGRSGGVGGAVGTVGASGAGAAALQALKTAAKPLRQPHHLLLYVGDKLLALYSSRGASDLSPPDMLLLATQCTAAQTYWADHTDIGLPWLSTENSGIVHLCAGDGGGAGGGVPHVVPCAPHALYLARILPGLTLVVLRDMGMGLREVGVGLCLLQQLVTNLTRVLLQRNLDLLPHTLDRLDLASKKVCEALRKSKSGAAAALWPVLAARTLDVRRSALSTLPLTPESAASALHAAIQPVANMLRPDIPSLNLAQSVESLRAALSPYAEFLRVKAARCFSLSSVGSLGSCSREGDGSLTLHKYVGEFPGLVHFVLVDRAAQRATAPDLSDCQDLLDADQLRGILSRSLRIVHEGYAGGAWRSGGLHVCAVTWWARRGQPVRPQRAPRLPAVRAMPPPGDMLGTFYSQLTAEAFPGGGGAEGADGAGLMELVTVHLGVVPANIALQHARTLAHQLPDLVLTHADLL